MKFQVSAIKLTRANALTLIIKMKQNESNRFVLALRESVYAESDSQDVYFVSGNVSNWLGPKVLDYKDQLFLLETLQAAFDFELPETDDWFPVTTKADY